ncbi:MAG: glycosyltransferase family 4 protein [Chthoniobacter sp.]|nr:glycosyltransferase family 4 protein [Chthoniobacter sp.]
MHDVTVSVWNKYWSPHLAEGLTNAGFGVLALGTTRRKPPCSAHRTCWSSGLLTQASFRVPLARDVFTGLAIDLYQRFATRHALESRCLWGWSNHHLAAFQKAKSAGISVILESGSTHFTWARDALAAEYARHGTRWETPLMRKVAPRMLAEYEIADFICVPNTFVARTYEEHGIPRSKLAINAYGMDFDFWSGASGKMTPERRFTVIFAGQFMLRKGVAYLMEAWQRLGLRDAELWIAGAILDDARSYLSDLPENVKLLGCLSPIELRDIYRSCDVFILPSLEEGMARAALEAMAAGLPLIVTPETGVDDVVRHGEDGWVIPSKSTDAIIAALIEAAEDRTATERRGQSARERARPYTWKAYGERAAMFLRRIVTPTPR